MAARLITDTPNSFRVSPLPICTLQANQSEPSKFNLSIPPAAGEPNKAVGIDLGISGRAREVHRASVMKTPGARSLPDLVKAKILLQQLSA